MDLRPSELRSSARPRWAGQATRLEFVSTRPKPPTPSREATVVNDYVTVIVSESAGNIIRSFPDRAEESMRGEPARGPSDVRQLGTSIPARMTCSPGRGQGADQFLG